MDAQCDVVSQQGKTLSTICSALQWLVDERERYLEGLDASVSDARDNAGSAKDSKSLADKDDDEPDWMLEHEEKQKVRERREKATRRAVRLAKARADLLDEKQQWQLGSKSQKKGEERKGSSINGHILAASSGLRVTESAAARRVKELIQGAAHNSSSSPTATNFLDPLSITGKASRDYSLERRPNHGKNEGEESKGIEKKENEEEEEELNEQDAAFLPDAWDSDVEEASGGTKNGVIRQDGRKGRGRKPARLHYGSSDDEANCREAKGGVSSDDDHEGQEEEEEEQSKVPRIFFCSRTHSQLAQFLGELRKTEFGSGNIRVVTLGSRKNLCINSGKLAF